MRESKIYIQEFPFVSVLNCSIEKKVNEHGSALISGYLTQELEINLLEKDHYNKFYSVLLEDESGNTQKIFTGIIEKLKIESENGVRKATICLAGGTRLMDCEKRIRTFQDSSLTYDSLFEKINESYTEAMYLLRYKVKEIENLIVQYQETDWEFLKRIASHLSLVLIPYYRNLSPCYYVGVESGMEPIEIEILRCSKISNNGEYYNKKSAGMESLFLQDSHYVEIISRDFCDLGDMVRFDNTSLCVHSIKSKLKGGELIHTYQLKLPQSFRIPKKYNEKIIGASLDGKVLDIKSDTVKIQVLEEQQKISEAKWFPYSTVYSSPDGSGWYCMPEKGDCVRLYFPSNKEEDAYVISSIHVSGTRQSSSRSNPDNKSISTKYGKTIELTPDKIIMTNNRGMSVVMDDQEGIYIVSDKDVIIQSEENISLTSKGDGLNFEAVESIELVQGNTSIILKEDLVVSGAKFRLE